MSRGVYCSPLGSETVVRNPIKNIFMVKAYQEIWALSSLVDKGNA
jgi:hypothetical protein